MEENVARFVVVIRIMCLSLIIHVPKTSSRDVQGKLLLLFVDQYFDSVFSFFSLCLGISSVLY